MAPHPSGAQRVTRARVAERTRSEGSAPKVPRGLAELAAALLPFRTPPSRDRLTELLQSCGLALAEQRTLGQETDGKRAWGGFAVATAATKPVTPPGRKRAQTSACVAHGKPPWSAGLGGPEPGRR